MLQTERYIFDDLKVKNQIIKWIRDQFEGTDHKAIIGISGGKDSSVAAGLCVEALGKDRVVGILMPNGIQNDIIMSYDIVRHLGIQHRTINIGLLYENFLDTLDDPDYSDEITFEISNQTKINIAPRLRMTMLYAISASLNGRVIGTSNLSETHIGYTTKWGDNVSDLNPLGGLTCTEVIAIGRLILPDKFVDKPPADGLTNKTDEDNFGFTYDELDLYIREHKINNEETKQRINKMHDNTTHKRWIPVYYPFIPTSNTTDRPHF